MTTQAVTYFQSATSSFRASARIVVLRSRPPFRGHSARREYAINDRAIVLRYLLRSDPGRTICAPRPRHLWNAFNFAIGGWLFWRRQKRAPKFRFLEAA
jgi:hypothetical protein